MPKPVKQLLALPYRPGTVIPMDLALVLHRLGLDNEDWGPDHSTYAALAAGWRGNPALLPSEATVNAEWSAILAEGGVGVVERDEFRAVARDLVSLSTTPIAKVVRAIAALLVKDENDLRKQVIGVVVQTWNPASMANNTGLTSPNVIVPGAAFGDFVSVAAPYALTGVIAVAYVSAVNTVQVRLQNVSGGAVDLASGDWKVVVWRPEVTPIRTLAIAKQAIVDELGLGTVD